MVNTTTMKPQRASETSRLPLWLGICAALAWPLVGLIMGSMRLWVDAESGEEVVNLGAIGVLIAVALSATGLVLALRRRRRGERTRVVRAAIWLNAVVLGWWVVLLVADLVKALVTGE
jgi:uncharacterized membrane protein